MSLFQITITTDLIIPLFDKQTTKYKQPIFFIPLSILSFQLSHDSNTSLNHKQKQLQPILQIMESQSEYSLQYYIPKEQQEQQPFHQPNQTESNYSCIECQQINRIQNLTSNNSISSADQNQYSQPFHRHVIEHSSHIENTINTLKFEISKLKKINANNQILIQSLKRELQKTNNVGKQKISHKKSSVKKREQNYPKITAQHDKKNQNLTDFYQSVAKPNCQQRLTDRINKIKVKFEETTEFGKIKNKPFNQIYQIPRFQSPEPYQSLPSNQQQIQYIPTYRPQKKLFKQFFSPDQKDYSSHLNETNNQGLNIQNQFELQNQKIHRLQRHLKFCENEMRWMSNFVVAFLGMTQKIMSINDQKVLKEDWDVKKKTKIAWRYIKHLLVYLIGT